MTYDLHPILVHFPIALLVLYSIIKILPLRTWIPKVSWDHIEALLLLCGTLGAFAALATGDIAEELARPNHRLVEAHSTFAALSTWLYGTLLVGEIAQYLSKSQSIMTKIGAPAGAVLVFLKKYLRDGWISKAIAGIALVSIAITGLLGGVLVYGTSKDPLANIVIALLGITL